MPAAASDFSRGFQLFNEGFETTAQIVIPGAALLVVPFSIVLTHIEVHTWAWNIGVAGAYTAPVSVNGVTWHNLVIAATGQDNQADDWSWDGNYLFTPRTTVTIDASSGGGGSTTDLLVEGYFI